MNELLLSVIVPVYNTAPWLRKCLDSICAQTYRNLEILCVNDGSTDNSAEILAEYAAKDARIRVFTQANAGLSAARNTALEHATGEWVTGVDSDDYLEREVYERAVGCINPEVDWVFFGVSKVDEAGRNWAMQGTYFCLPEAAGGAMEPGLARRLNVCFVSKLWRRSVLEAHRLRFPVGAVHEDEALFCVYAPFVRRVAFCHYEGYRYMQREGSIMNLGKDAALIRARHYVPAIEFTCREYRRLGLLQPPQQEYLVNMLVHLCGMAYWLDEDGEKQRLLKQYAEIFREYGLEKANYMLERMVPLRWWQRLYLRRCAGARLYCLFGFPVVAQQFDDTGWPVGIIFFPYECLRKWLTGCSGKKPVS